MVDISQFSNVAALAVLVAIIVQLVKSQLQAKLVPYAAIAVGVALAVVLGVVQQQIHTAADLVSWVVGGFLAALLAIGGYEASLDKIKL